MATNITGESYPNRREAHVVAMWCQAFKDRCRNQGIRVTPQRLAVYQALAEDLTHPGAEAIYVRLKPEIPSLSLATVYRILEALVGQGLIRKVSTEGGTGRFDANVEPHQHLVCRTCSQLVDFEDPALAGISVPHETAAGFLAQEVEVRILGLCQECRGASSSGSA